MSLVDIDLDRGETLVLINRQDGTSTVSVSAGAFVRALNTLEFCGPDALRRSCSELQAEEVVN